MRITKKQQKLNSQRMSRLYGAHCAGLQVNVFALSGIYDAGNTVMVAGGTDEQIGAALRTATLAVCKNGSGLSISMV